MTDHDDTKVVIRGDAAEVGSYNASFFILTLLNFEYLSKCNSFNFVINLTEVQLFFFADCNLTCKLQFAKLQTELINQ